jgi:thiol:disulfide interchange protein DsbC
MSHDFRLALACLMVSLPFFAVAQQPAAPPAKADPRAEIAKKIAGVKADDLRPAPIPGLYEIARGTDFAYVSSDAKYVIAGDLYDLDTDENLTETRRRGARLKLLSGMSEAEMLVFAPKDPKYKVTVFTDIDCGYCRQLHKEMAELNRLGVSVRYLFYPRSGPGTASWEKAEDVWCAQNRNDALTRAKRGEEIKSRDCGATPVSRHYGLGQDMSLRGTPAIVLSNGDLLPGYLPPAALVQRLKAVK